MSFYVSTADHWIFIYNICTYRGEIQWFSVSNAMHGQLCWVALVQPATSAQKVNWLQKLRLCLFFRSNGKHLHAKVTQGAKWSIHYSTFESNML